MNTTALTKSVRILTDFEIRLCHNRQSGDERMTLACAPVAQDAATIAWYVITNGDDSPLAIQNDNCVTWGTAAFGSLDASDEWLTQESGWLNADELRSAIADLPRWGNYENLMEFADALESKLASEDEE